MAAWLFVPLALCLEIAEGEAPPPAYQLDWDQGQAAVAQENWTAAAESFREYREKRPESVNGYVMEGFCRKMTGEIPAARALFEKALALDPSQPHALYNLAELDWLDERPVEALARLRSIKKYPPDQEENIHHLLGLTLVATNQAPEEAALHLSRVIEPDQGTLQFLALAWLRTHRLEAAAPVLRKLCPTEPGESLAGGWVRCAAVRMCPSTSRRIHEILRHLVKSPSETLPDHIAAEVVRLQVRDGEAGLETRQLLADLIARRPQACRLKLLQALISLSSGQQSRDEGCRFLDEASLCVENNGDAIWPEWPGPVTDPKTGSNIDLDNLDEALSSLHGLYCNLGAFSRTPPPR